MSLQPILANLSQLTLERYKSNLNLDAFIGENEINVYSVSQFAVNQIVIIGEIGNEGTELILTHASTAPSGNTITLVSALVKDHPKDTPVYIVPFDQIELSRATTLTGSKSVLGSLLTIDPEKETMIYDEVVNTTGYYFLRFKNSLTGIFSDYSDGVPFAGLTENTVGYAINTAMDELGVDFSDSKITYGMLFGWANQMLHLVRGKLKSWSEYQEFDYVVGTMSMGVRRFAMPITCYDVNSNKSVINVRVGDGLPLIWMTRSEYVQAMERITYTEIATLAVVGGTSLVLDDTSDLDDTGSVDVYVSGTKYTVEYTVNTRSTNTLTVAADQITYAFPVDSPVIQGVQENDPEYYSIFDGYIYPFPFITSDYEGRNLIMDFYTDIVTVDSDMDTIPGARFDMLIQYLKWKIKGFIENKGKEDMKDSSYLQFKEILFDATRLAESGERNSFGPRGDALYSGRGRR
jgi:hypothetical protein